MASIDASKSQVLDPNLSRKCYSSTGANFSIDASALAIRVSETAAYDDTPSPSSIGSTSTLGHSPRYRQSMLSSTMKTKEDHRLKHRSRYGKLFRHSQVVNRQYMTAMTNILFQMQKELYRLRRRTHRIEQFIVKQGTTDQPIIRIPRLTEDQLTTICLDETHDAIEDNPIQSEHETLSDIEQTPVKPARSCQGTSQPCSKYCSGTCLVAEGRGKYDRNTKKRLKKRKPRIWTNNRQRTMDPEKYCTACRYEFSKRANFLCHVRKAHQGIIPPAVNKPNHSIAETSENGNNEPNSEGEITREPLESEPSEALANSCDNGHVLSRKRSGAKSTLKAPKQPKVKCDICSKFYRANYLKRHQRRIHGVQETSSSSAETNDDTDQQSSTIDKPTADESNPLPTALSTENQHNRNALPTPTIITVADMNDYEEPIRLLPDSAKTIVLAVTCLEAYQLDLIEQFLEKFSSQVCQTTSIDARTTHLITNDEQQVLRSPLSMKLIEAIAHHCFCVSYRWILDCLKYERLIEEASYEIEGDNTEAQSHQGPRRSRLIPNRQSLFRDVCFMIKCTENADIRMTNERLEDLITTCGGQIITCVTQRLLDKYQIVVLCDLSYVSERRHNYEQCRELGIHFVSSDWVLESILEYRPKPFTLFEEVPL